MLKAYYVYINNEQPPYTHKLIRLAEVSNLYKNMSDIQKDFIDTISPLNLEARYPTQKETIFQALNKNNCKDIIKQTEEMIIWIKNKLNN